MIKVIHSGQTGAPVLSGTAGSMLDVLDACLVNGFGSKSMVSGVIAGGVATITVSGGHAMSAGTIVAVDGATPAPLNGEHVVTATATNTISFATAEADGAITGTVNIKVASLGWLKPFTGTNKRVYASQSLTATQFCLRVDDTATQDSRVVGYESMTDVDTGTAPFPTSAQLSDGLYWPKSDAASSSARAWMIVGDEASFHIAIHFHVTNTTLPTTMSFGDILPLKSGDNYACMLAGLRAARNTSIAITNGDSAASTRTVTGEGARYIARSHVGVGGSQPAYQVGESANGSTPDIMSGFSGYGVTGAFPNAADNSLLLGRPMIYANGGYRGVMAGVYHMVQDASAGLLSQRLIIDGTGEMAGRKLMAAQAGASTSTLTQGYMFFDITGPWR